MHTQLLVCNQITPDVQYTLGTIINHIKVKVLPAVVDLPFLLKIIDMPKNEEVFTEIKITNSLGEILSTISYVHRNYRKEGEVPGVDHYFEVALLVEELGTITIECYIDDEKMNWYPIQIDIENEL
ncbi:hypothetical protein ACFSTH_14505 [Paenibacillus yanchengensis]|uniref:Uncharacterized protein n=1 Tax=Paenibacillus yanchengensis TaxID=2035833 RepID=A0ABW4YF01_9BACL